MSTLARGHSLRRMACVDVPDLPLQMLLRKHPAYRDAPTALVAEERPESPLLLLNRHARSMRLRTGMRFGAAKSLVPELCAGAIAATELEQAVASLVRDLQTFSPHVERDPVSSGVFYVDPSGLSHLYGGELSWARCVQRFLSGRNFFSTVLVAYGRALSYALARITRGVRVVDGVEQALVLAVDVPLERLQMQPKLRDSLERMGLFTLGDLSSFGVDQLSLRFGAEAAHWCRVSRGDEVLPLCAEPHLDTPRSEVEIDPPDHDVARLCFGIKRGLDELIENVRQRGASVRALWLRLLLEHSPSLTATQVVACESVQRLEPSTPTRDAALLMELLRLRLSALSLSAAVTRVVLEAELSDATQGQLSMFTPKRDLMAGDRALARIKARYGDDVVCRAMLEDAHLPEAKFRWASLDHLELPKVEDAENDNAAPLVRRLLPRPELLAGELEHQHGSLDKVLLHRGERLSLVGPYRVSGGWWGGREVMRDYYYARTKGGELWWVFYDHRRQTWFVHAVVD